MEAKTMPQNSAFIFADHRRRGPPYTVSSGPMYGTEIDVVKCHDRL
jgi:hypothetical protein